MANSTDASAKHLDEGAVRRELSALRVIAEEALARIAAIEAARD